MIISWSTIVDDKAAAVLAHGFYQYIGERCRAGHRKASLLTAFKKGELLFKQKFRVGDPEPYAGASVELYDKSVSGIYHIFHPELHSRGIAASAAPHAASPVLLTSWVEPLPGVSNTCVITGDWTRMVPEQEHGQGT